MLRRAAPDQVIALRDRVVALSPLFQNGDGAQRVIQALLRADAIQLASAAPQMAVPRSGADMLALLDRVDPPSPTERATRHRQTALAMESPIDALLAPADDLRLRDDARLSAAARELALAYALSHNENDLASARSLHRRRTLPMRN